MGDIFDIFSGGFPDLKKTVGRFAAYTLLFIWTIKKQYGSADEIATTFFYWFFRVSLVLAVVSFIGFVFFAIGYMDYLKADDKLVDDSKRLKDWQIRVGLFNKVGWERSVGFTVAIYIALTFLVCPFSEQTMLTSKELFACAFLIKIGFVAVITLCALAFFKDTYIMIDQRVYALDTNNSLTRKDKTKSWKTPCSLLERIFLPIVILVLLSVLLIGMYHLIQSPIGNSLLHKLCCLFHGCCCH